MRVAICFWGLCRSTHYTLDSLERWLFSILRNAGIDYTIYLHALTIEGPYNNPRSQEKDQVLDTNVWNHLKPDLYSIENQADVDTKLSIETYLTHGDPWGKEPSQTTLPHHTFQNHLRALYSLDKVTALWETSGVVYDAILYVRPDVRLLVPFKLVWLTELEANQVGCPTFQTIDGWNDRFCLAKPKEASIWGHRFQRAETYSLQKPLHSERFLADTMKSNGITAKYICFPFRRIRADGRVCPADVDL